MAEFDATKGGETANSYATVAEADEYLAFEYGADDWESVENEQKEKLLVTASRMLSGLNITFDPASDTQALPFPITPKVAGESDGFNEAKEAAILQAHYLYQYHDAIQDGLSKRILGVRSESMGKVSTAISGLNPLARFSGRALAKVADFIDLSLKIHRA